MCVNLPGYAHPVQGLVAVVDLNEMEVLKVEDHEIVDIPQEPCNYATKFIDEFRSNPKPISITQPEGSPTNNLIIIILLTPTTFLIHTLSF